MYIPKLKTTLFWASEIKLNETVSFFFKGRPKIETAVGEESKGRQHIEHSTMKVNQDGELLGFVLMDVWEVKASRDLGESEMVMSLEETPVLRILIRKWGHI